ncbi:hypothetical protein JL720_11778 [Aureococcus anophagefferens]|nr:hypothetical protein JL720_11778 [Aureococcus anophagefferens]
MPRVRDRCDGSYGVEVELVAPGSYRWTLTLRADGGANATPPCADYDAGPLRRRALAPGPPGSLSVKLARDGPSRYYKGLDPKRAGNATWALKWRPAGCTYPPSDARRLQDALRGRTVVAAGDSTIRLMFMNFLQAARPGGPSFHAFARSRASPVALGVPVTHCNVDRCLCHGLFEVRLDARTWPYGDTVLDCHETARGFGGVAPPCDDDEIVLVFVFHTLLDCRLLKYGEFGARFDLGACLKSSGEVREGNEFLGAVVPRADAVLFQIGFHVVGRLGVKGCIESTNARMAACNAYMRDFARRGGGAWTYLGGQYEMSWLGEDLNKRAPEARGGEQRRGSRSALLGH